MPALLDLANIDVNLDGKPILRGIDMKLMPGQFVVVMGPSGVGKTTLLRLVAGLIAPDAGTRRLDARAAIVFQEPRLLPWQSALDNAGVGLRASGLSHSAARQRAASMLTRLNLSTADQAKQPAALSGGMRQRVALARALVLEPRLLLLDEPFSALDTPLRQSLQDLLRGIVEAEGLSAILVTHDPLEAVRLADRIIVLKGAPATIAADILQARPARGAAQAYRAAADLMALPSVVAAFEKATPLQPSTAMPAAPPQRSPAEPEDYFQCRSCGGTILEWSGSPSDDDFAFCKSCGASAGVWGRLCRDASEPFFETLARLCRGALRTPKP